MKRALLLLALPLLGAATASAACSSSPQSPAAASAQDAGAGSPDGGADAAANEVVEERLGRMLQGRFDSAEQAKQDRSYFSVNLRICEATSDLAPRVLYVEQALSTTLDQPYRQRLYVIDRLSETAARSRVFELRKPTAAIGACDRGAAPSFDAKDAIELAGCAVEMHWVGDHFEGRTPDMTWDGAAFRASSTPDACKNDHQGASYATSEVSLFADRLVSWDRGYDAKGAQVWGAIKGGYVFVRRPRGS